MPEILNDTDIKKLVEEFCEETSRDATHFARDPNRFESGKQLGNLPAEQRVVALRYVLAEIQQRSKPRSTLVTLIFGKSRDANTSDWMVSILLIALVSKLLRAKLPMTSADLEQLISCALIRNYPFGEISLNTVLRAIELFKEDHPLTEPLLNGVRQLQKQIHEHLARPMNAITKEIREQFERIDVLLSKGPSAANTPKPFDTGEPWAAAAQADIDALPPDARAKFNALLFHLQTADSSKPSKKWLKEAGDLLNDFGRDRFAAFVTHCLPLTPKNRDTPPSNMRHQVENLLFTERSQVTLKGLVWAASLFDDPAISAALGDLGETCWKKIPNIGPRSKLVGNAVLWSLSAIGNNHAVAQLTRINSKLKHASARKLADKAMNRIAEASGQTRDDLEELAVPTFNLDADGSVSRTVGDFNCTITLTPDLEAKLTITGAENKIRKTVPVDLKTNPDFKALQKSLKDLNALLPAQRYRIESILRSPDRSWSFANWKTRYLDHPILSHFARRLIWLFNDGTHSITALPHKNSFLTATDAVYSPTPTTTVKLYHPCTDTLDSVRAWREFLQRHQITQPFKQAHREIYLLTDAERTTSTYSNRFAAHIIRQHQFAALCAARGWKYRLQGAWDGANTPTLELPAHLLKIEFWVDQVEANENGLTQSFVSILLTTDQVRFIRWQPEEISPHESLRRFLEELEKRAADRAAGRPPQPTADPHDELLPLDQIQPQLFSEILRDVDLFVGVCSVGNDPAWNDGGPDGRYRAYWQKISFGDLSATAQTRKEILATLLPRLAIAPQASLTDKFLIIRGSLRTYKIHLGSANILMEPNDQYLCIVPGRSTQATTTGKLYLPFEGDQTLAVILSKAVLLANDSQIKDHTILTQIRRL